MVRDPGKSVPRMGKLGDSSRPQKNGWTWKKQISSRSRGEDTRYSIHIVTADLQPLLAALSKGHSNNNNDTYCRGTIGS